MEEGLARETSSNAREERQPRELSNVVHKRILESTLTDVVTKKKVLRLVKIKKHSMQEISVMSSKRWPFKFLSLTGKITGEKSKGGQKNTFVRNAVRLHGYRRYA